MSVKQQIGDNIVNKTFQKVDVDSLVGSGKRIGIYFSAHWCPPCRSFTPVLADYYKKQKGKHGDKFEIIFVSRDHDEKSFKDYYATMPWLTVAYEGDRNGIASSFKVSGIPCFCIINAEDGELITKDGRSVVSSNGDIMAC